MTGIRGHFNIFSQWDYAIEHFKEGAQSSKLKHYTLGALEVLPGIGLFVAAVEHGLANRISNLTSDNGLVMREKELNRQLESTSGHIQAVYLSAWGSVERKKDFNQRQKGLEVLGFSSPDKTFLNLYHEVKAFKKDALPEGELAQLNEIIRQMELAKPLYLKRVWDKHRLKITKDK